MPVGRVQPVAVPYESFYGQITGKGSITGGRSITATMAAQAMTLRARSCCGVSDPAVPRVDEPETPDSTLSPSTWLPSSEQSITGDHRVGNLVALVTDAHDRRVALAAGVKLARVGLADVGAGGLALLEEDRSRPAVAPGHRDDRATAAFSLDPEGARARRLSFHQGAGNVPGRVVAGSRDLRVSAAEGTTARRSWFVGGRDDQAIWGRWLRKLRRVGWDARAARPTSPTSASPASAYSPALTRGTRCEIAATTS
jgi:hypothetical protein